jgi:hypothetical protein
MTREELLERAKKMAGGSDYFKLASVDVAVNDWKKGGRDRTYIDFRHYTGMGRLSKVYKCGYYDNATGEYVVRGGEYNIVEDWFE